MQAHGGRRLATTTTVLKGDIKVKSVQTLAKSQNYCLGAGQKGSGEIHRETNFCTRKSFGEGLKEGRYLTGPLQRKITPQTAAVGQVRGCHMSGPDRPGTEVPQ